MFNHSFCLRVFISLTRHLSVDYISNFANFVNKSIKEFYICHKEFNSVVLSQRLVGSSTYRMQYNNGKETLPLYNSTNSVNDNDIETRTKTSTGTGASTEIRILGVDLSQYNAQTQFIICCVGIFILYIIYGYFQELIFSLDGFKPHGWYLTLIQFGYCTIFGYLERRIQNPEQCGTRKIPMKTYGFLAFLTLGTMGLSNSSLGYLNYPTQVIFKCCKLVPVLIGSILIQKKSHGPLDFLAAIAMCVGLAAFTLGN